MLSQLTAVLLVDTSTIDDTGGLGDGRGNSFGKPLTDRSVDFLGLLGSGDLSGSDSPGDGTGLAMNWRRGKNIDVPDWLIGNNNVGPLLLGNLASNGL